eukprot:snap_masked-scaffold_1-processed-gene-12.19-mRNA-1 protein AED:0.19 eAED:0.21 QI:0/-1/0/1/-1/1/1/0/349
MPKPKTNTSSQDSKSLWNYALSPGWTKKETEVYRLVLMKYGLGKWSDIISSGFLPHKTANQLNMQMQRMLGQQSTAEFFGLHIDPEIIWQKNIKIKGLRKNGGCLVNMGNNPTKEETNLKREKNKEYELSKKEIEDLFIPRLLHHEIWGSKESLEENPVSCEREDQIISYKLEDIENLLKEKSLIERILERRVQGFSTSEKQNEGDDEYVRMSNIRKKLKVGIEKHSKFQLFQRVRLQFSDKSWYDGTIVKVNVRINNTFYDIEFDDGDFEKDVEEKDVFKIEEKNFEKGEKVEVMKKKKNKEEINWIQARVLEIKENTVRVEYKNKGKRTQEVFAKANIRKLEEKEEG